MMASPSRLFILPTLAALVLTVLLVNIVLADTPATRPSTAGKVVDSAKDVQPLQVGDPLPAGLTLKTVDGKPFDLNAAVAAKPTILIFYRGGWCPFCNQQMSNLESVLKDLTDAGYQLLAITPDKPDEIAKSVAKHSLTYTLLSDSDAATIKAFGLAFKVDDATIKRYVSMNIDLDRSSGESHHILPVPAVYILSTSSGIKFVHFDPDYRKRMDAAKIVTEAKAALTK